MNITIEIHYKADSNIMQRASFPLKGRKPEYIALQFWKDIKKELPYNAVLEQVISAGEDITEKVKELEKQQLLKIMNDDLPF
ncbi:hypothetical protein J7E81_15390 [Bacillus sp. ISL-18]|uniref:hypothetical protein n=1 Tax=Bacillus sp. ISL-18 TaxID=2819118 RepID=UPI001BEC2566|nr:hypothetical protein [Bacillus sp. ISL-18]MBT2656602.1 hypothetical protein [Bacillus sp. ISL-18]